ncbi:MAG TPA: thioredoxin family protein [Polyangiaceae bacterium]|nr:thioredoxin family protein [Polyangiaceae bacterium]
MPRWWVLGAMLVACRTTPELSADLPATNDAAVQPANIEPWNPAGIDWQTFDEGLALAKKQGKRVCLVLFTTWCPHCKSYSRVFADPRLVARAKDFVMIRLDADLNDAVAKRYSPDGSYVPRTFILDSDGNIQPGAVSDNPRYKHFFDESRADPLLRAMDVAP